MDKSFLLKIIVSISAIFIAQAAIPLVRAFVQMKRKRNAFLAYLRAHVRNSLASYGDRPCSIEDARKHLGCSPDWMTPLQDAGLGIPEVLIQMHSAIAKAQTEQAHEEGYIPFLSYLGISHAVMEHSSPLWDMNEDESMQVSKYLITQEQVLSSLEAQYEETYMKLIYSDSIIQRHQWCQAAFSILEDMAEHYINALSLKKMLNGH